MKAILACDINGGIGLNGSMPWNKLDGDLPRFKKLTENSTVIMGRGTWESTDMPTPLPNRTNVVVSSKNIKLPQGVWKAPNCDHLDQWHNAWLIGGAKLFNSMLDKIRAVWLTRVPENYNCDTSIDLLQLEYKFRLLSEEQFSDHSLQIWWNKDFNETIPK